MYRCGRLADFEPLKSKLFPKKEKMKFSKKKKLKYFSKFQKYFSPHVILLI